MTPAQFTAATGASLRLAARWQALLEAAMAEFGIDTPARQALFLAQIGVESRGLQEVSENLNYSVEGLKIFGNRFTDAERAQYGRSDKHPADQRMIANIAYAYRYGNGDRTSGDGWAFRGGSPAMLTFRDNYRDAERQFGVLLTQFPRRIEEPSLGSRVAAWFWRRHNLNRLADEGDVDGISHIINGGSNGIDARRARSTLALEALGCANPPTA